MIGCFSLTTHSFLFRHGEDQRFKLRLLREKVVTGLIFHPTYSAALDVPSVNLAKQWIRSHGEDLWGV